MYASVYVYRPLDTPYTYVVPKDLEGRIGRGSRVLVPLGKGETIGLVWDLTDAKPEGVPYLKPIYRVLEHPPALPEPLLGLAERIAAHYLCSIGEALAAMVPSYAPPAPPPRFELCMPLEDALAAVGARAPRQAELLHFLAENAHRETRRSHLGGAAQKTALRQLVAKGLVRQCGEDVPGLADLVGGPEPGGTGAGGSWPSLTALQQPVFAAVAADLAAGRHRVHLVHGVTGSGKTEIYLALMRAALEAGRTALFLVPEIALTVPMIEKVRARFGGALAVLHSQLASRERYLEWARLRTGAARVVLGPRSAVFAPVTDLGLVVLDEEQEGSYKQQDKPRYHAREVAAWRGEREGFPVLLGSATPSLEAFYGATRAGEAYHRIERRFRQAALPPVELVDMAKEFAEKRNRSVFSMALKTRMEATLAAGGQALLFMNRRGFHTHVFCRPCGYVLECKDCAVPMTYHFEGAACLCHHCGHKIPPPTACPACRSPAIRYAGTGTQRIAREFALNFPGVEFDRMDSDTTRRKGELERILARFQEGRTRVLIGTQIVAKGFDFPKLNLVGVVHADGSLNLPDFRGAERTFHLITQVAGRVGRGDDPGHVIVQTYQPEHYALAAARTHDYQGFAAQELRFRETLFYPPFSRLVLFLSEGPDPEAAAEPLRALRQHFMKALGERFRLQALGPAPAPLTKLEGVYRQQLLVKHELSAAAGAAVREALARFEGDMERVRVDADPLHLL